MSLVQVGSRSFFKNEADAFLILSVNCSERTSLNNSNAGREGIDIVYEIGGLT